MAVEVTKGGENCPVKVTGKIAQTDMTGTKTVVTEVCVNPSKNEVTSVKVGAEAAPTSLQSWAASIMGGSSTKENSVVAPKLISGVEAINDALAPHAELLRKVRKEGGMFYNPGDGAAPLNIVDIRQKSVQVAAK